MPRPYLRNPEGNENLDVDLLGEPIEVVPERDQGDDDEADVEMQEELVERSANNGGGLQNNRNEGNDGLDSLTLPTFFCRALCALTISPVVDSAPDRKPSARPPHPPPKLTLLIHWQTA